MSISDKKSVKKSNINKRKSSEYPGLKGDTHAGRWCRKVSLLDMESLSEIQEKGLDGGPGDFTEIISQSGLRLWELPIGSPIRLGRVVSVEVIAFLLFLSAFEENHGLARG
jgi:MOSC domain-containing protein YiiM